MRKEKYYGQAMRIARWKRETLLEGLLAQLSDRSEVCKRLYVLYYKIANRKYFHKGIKMIDKQLSIYKEQFTDVDRNYLIRDMVYCLHRFGISFEEYCIYYFVRRSFYSRSKFVSDKLRHYYCELVNKKEISQILDDKCCCYNHYKEFFKREVLGCYSVGDKLKFQDFVRLHKKCIIKPMEGNCGHGVQIMSFENEIASSSFFDKVISQGPFVVEELIAQGKEMASLHPQSINSVRVSTFVLGGTVQIIAAVLRIGKGTSVVDNAGSGGMYASVDIEHGIVQTGARTYTDKHYNIHPDTGTQIVGFRLPQWSEALSLVRQMALKMEGSTLIAWDIAYSERGWLMVEGNAVGSWDVLQSNLQIGLKPRLFMLMDKYFELN